MCIKKDFLMYPAKECCTSIMSMAPPRSGKTYVMINCVKEWLEMGMFEKIVMILPQFKKEMNDTYGFLKDVPNVYVYESFNDAIMKKYIDEQEKYSEMYTSKKIDKCPRMLFVCDDATGQKSNLFKSSTMLRIVTENRHLRIHSWVLLHYAKGIIQPCIRENLQFIFVYPLKDKLMRMIYDDFVNFPKTFPTYEVFEAFYNKYVDDGNNKYPVLLLNGKESFNPDVCKWFSK